MFRGVVPRREMMDGLFRIDIPAYGDDALREAVMNAFIHRDFTCPEPVIIQIMPQQCVITNPGGFYRDVSPENILFHEPCPRNQCLAHACVHLNLMERSGRGVDRIFWDQIRFMRQMPSYLDSTQETVRLNLPGGEGSLEAIRWMLDYFAEKDLRVRVVHGGLIHVLLSEGEASRDALVAGLPGLNEQFGRRAITELINGGIMSRIGHGPGQRIVLSPQFLKRLGMPEAFVHQAGLELERQKHMILQYVDRHGSITRGEAAKLLGMKADNAVYRLHPKTVPQSHNANNIPTLGGYYQERGQVICINEIAWAVATVAGPAAKIAVLTPEKSEAIVAAAISLVKTLGETMLDDKKTVSQYTESTSSSDKLLSLAQFLDRTIRKPQESRQLKRHVAIEPSIDCVTKYLV